MTNIYNALIIVRLFAQTEINKALKPPDHRWTISTILVFTIIVVNINYIFRKQPIFCGISIYEDNLKEF